MSHFLSRILDFFFKRVARSANTIFIERQFDIRIKDAELYELALTHRSYILDEDNERLELLGDAVLDLIVADYIFHLFPGMDEGLLTKLKSKFISRENLIKIANKEGLTSKLEVRKQKDLDQELIIGNMLEALFGAIYIDQGYEIAKTRAIDMFERSSPADGLINNLHDPKSQLLEWGQKQNREIRFEVDAKGRDKFIAQLYVDEELIAKGSGKTKKKSEKQAARRAIETLEIKED